MNLELVVVGKATHGVSCRWLQKRVDGIGCMPGCSAHVAGVIEDPLEVRSLFGRFERRDLRLAQQRETDIVPTVEQALARQWIDLEATLKAGVGNLDASSLDVHDDESSRVGFYQSGQLFDVGRLENDDG